MNLDIDTFTYITGIAGLLGLLLQFKDSFPEHRETRKTVVLLVIGVFIGSLISSARGLKIDIASTFTPFAMLVTVCIALLAIIVLAAIFSPDHNKRDQLFGVAGFGTFAFLLMLFFGAMVNGLDSGTNNESKQLTIDELLEISSNQLMKGNFDRSLHFLEAAQERIGRNDPRYKVIESRINQIKEKQVATKQ